MSILHLLGAILAHQNSLEFRIYEWNNNKNPPPRVLNMWSGVYHPTLLYSSFHNPKGSLLHIATGTMTRTRPLYGKKIDYTDDGWSVHSFDEWYHHRYSCIFGFHPSIHQSSINRNHCHPKQSLVAVAHYYYYSDDHWSLHFWSSSHPIGLDHLVSPGRCSIIAIPPAWTFWSLVGSLFWLLLRECLWSSSTRVTK